MNFQKTILLFSLFILILVFIFIGIGFSNSVINKNWPPIISDCPDYWIDMSGNGAECYNVLNLGICNIPTTNNKNYKNFNIDEFKGSNGICAKYNWAKNCKLEWDGITSDVNNSCLSTT